MPFCPCQLRFTPHATICRWLRTCGCLVLVVAGTSLRILHAGDAAADIRNDAEHWAYRPLSRPTPPPTNLRGWEAWPRTPIDSFVLASLNVRGLHPSPEADRPTLIRRLYLDLIGLPPTVQEVEVFSRDPSVDAYERVVERLLGSPHYGERWARHWMDVIQFAETHGHDQDRPREHAWPYRDYLIRSFNQDKPYPRFVEEQVAGDVLFPDDSWATVATGFLATGPWDESSLMSIQEGSIDRLIGQYLDRDDIVTTTMAAFVSSTVHCARCHDHKFDPISQDEYYGLQAVFSGIDKANRAYDPDPGVGKRRRDLAAELEHFSADDDSVQARRLREELAALGPPRLVYAGTAKFKPNGGFRPAGKPRPVHVLARGDVHSPGLEARPRSLDLVVGLSGALGVDSTATEGARRAALARWLADPGNALAWRSIVNRLWHHHFGRGIVETPSDFGRMGGAPSHPLLLDWLAVTLLEGDGSLKQLHRLIVMSSVYRQSSGYDSTFAAVDANNRYLWRMNRRRLDAESVRDSVLAISARLDTTMSGPSVKQFNETKGRHVTPNVDYLNFDVDDPANYRRSVYRFIFRTLPDPFMESLDCPDPSLRVPKRSHSVTALQALSLLNDRFMVRQSEHIAARAAAAGDDASERVGELYRLVLGRAPMPDELVATVRYVVRHGLANAARYLLNTNEFLFVE